MKFISAGAMANYVIRDISPKSSSIKISYCGIYVNNTLFWETKEPTEFLP
jgi:hypothetical protein